MDDSDSAPSETDLIDSVKQHTRTPLSPEEYEQIKPDIFSIVPHLVQDNSYFVCGEYDDGEREQRLETVCERLFELHEVRGEDSYSFLMKDVETDYLNGRTKFCVIADHVERIVVVCERDRGGALIEQGIVSFSQQYFGKTSVMKRSYGPDEEKSQYSWMQSNGVFDDFARADRLFEWTSDDELEALCGTVCAFPTDD